MTFVEVIDINGNVEGPKDSDTSDAENDFLGYAVVITTSIEASGNPAVAAVGDIGVQQIEGNVAISLGFPDLDWDNISSQFDMNDDPGIL